MFKCCAKEMKKHVIACLSMIHKVGEKMVWHGAVWKIVESVEGGVELFHTPVVDIE